MNEDEGRREFLKKAGAVAWVVPTLQLVNMSSALAGDQTTGSVVSTTKPPSSTTTEAPECKCALQELGREPSNDGRAAVSFHIGVSDDCVGRAKYLRGYGNGQQFADDTPFNDTFVVLIPFDSFPLNLRIEVLDANMNVLTSCQTVVEGMANQEPDRAGAGGGRVAFG